MKTVFVHRIPFSRNRDRLLDHDVPTKFFAAVVEKARAAHLMRHDHFTVDGTLIEAMASLKTVSLQGFEA